MPQGEQTAPVLRYSIAVVIARLQTNSDYNRNREILLT